MAGFGALGVFVAYCAMYRLRGRFVREALAMAGIAGSGIYLMERFLRPWLERG